MKLEKKLPPKAESNSNSVRQSSYVTFYQYLPPPRFCCKDKQNMWNI